MSILTTHQLTRRFGSFTAVDQLALSVEAGEIFGLLGPNGAGKSTTIKVLTTLLPPTSGNARIGGYDVQRQPTLVQRLIGYVPQALSADSTLSGFENMLLLSKFYDLPRRQRRPRIEDILRYVGLESVADKLVRTYSGGMIRRLEIAQALLHAPKVLFLDEPTVGLDPVARKAMWELILQLRQERGTTIFLTTHFMDEADSLCDRIAIMHQGQVVAQDTPQGLKAGIPQTHATLDDVFIHYTGNDLNEVVPGSGTPGGNYRDTSATRHTAQRLG
ncbi:MAG: ATP-binding cassette domain-containing protein [Thermostichus sp. DG02_5_bins_236]